MILQFVRPKLKTNIKNMKSLKTLFIAVFVALFTAGAVAQTSRPLAVVKSFYAYDGTHSQVFSRQAIEARRPWFSKELYDLFIYELRRESAYLRKHPTDKPYFGDGLPFRPIDETCKVGRQNLHKGVSFKFETGNGQFASVQAIFAFPAPCKDPDTTIYKINLVNAKAGWLIDDVLYEDNHPLKQDLKRKEY